MQEKHLDSEEFSTEENEEEEMKVFWVQSTVRIALSLKSKLCCDVAYCYVLVLFCIQAINSVGGGEGIRPN